MNNDQRMRYEYTAYYETDEERIAAITEDILREYPALGSLARVAAEMETPFGRVHEDYDQFADDENRINRLIDIIIVTEGNPELTKEYQKACQELNETYRRWQYNFTYANPEEQEPYVVMEAFRNHQVRPSIPLKTFKMAEMELRQMRMVRDAQEKWKWEHRMQYGYTAYYDTEEERIAAISEDILREYPRLEPIISAIAKMETPFGRVHEDYSQYADDENRINRLIDIVIATEGKPEFVREYEKACHDLIEAYSYWERNFSYANPEDQEPYVIMEAFRKHQQNPDVPLKTYEAARREIRQRREMEEAREKWQRDHTMRYDYTEYYDTEEERIAAISEDILREYPRLAPVIRTIAQMETPFGRVHEDYDQFADDENRINRLIDIIIVTEGNPEYQEEYARACAEFARTFRNWQYNFTYANPEEQAPFIIWQQFVAHEKDKSIPLVTFAEATEIAHRKGRSF